VVEFHESNAAVSDVTFTVSGSARVGAAASWKSAQLFRRLSLDVHIIRTTGQKTEGKPFLEAALRE